MDCIEVSVLVENSGVERWQGLHFPAVPHLHGSAVLSMCMFEQPAHQECLAASTAACTCFSWVLVCVCAELGAGRSKSSTFLSKLMVLQKGRRLSYRDELKPSKRGEFLVALAGRLCMQLIWEEVLVCSLTLEVVCLGDIRCIMSSVVVWVHGAVMCPSWHCRASLPQQEGSKPWMQPDRPLWEYYGHMASMIDAWYQRFFHGCMASRIEAWHQCLEV
eukprot:1159369-Pelagomonas_calceolata.AAC.5